MAFELFAKHLHNSNSPWESAPPWAIELREMLRLALKGESIIMTVQADIAAALAQLTTDVAAQTTVTSSVVTYIQGIQQQIAALAAQTTDTTTAAALTALDQQITANTAADAAAIVVNTPTPAAGAPPVSMATAKEAVRLAMLANPPKAR